MAKYKFITDASPASGLYIFGYRFLTREEAKKLLKELESVTAEWYEEKTQNNNSHPYGKF